MKTLAEIKNVLHAHTRELREKHGLTNLAVFGSVVRGEAVESSDVDILADVERPIGLIALIGAENHLTELLGVKVDLIPREDVRAELKERIYKEAVPV
jgi:predicted nucleotidyltransferase